MISFATRIGITDKECQHKKIKNKQATILQKKNFCFLNIILT